MKRFRKVYLEISNRCNLHCAFCPGTRREPRAMTAQEVSILLSKLAPYTDFVYFHLMGEPLCHPQLGQLLQLAHQEGLKVILTTNGTLLKKQQSLLLASPALHKVNVSLHAFEANDLSTPFSQYLADCFSFGQAAEGKVLVSYRLWNDGGADTKNQEIIENMHSCFPGEWITERRGIRIGNRLYLEHGEKFDWPDLSVPEGSQQVFCYGLRDQIGVLCDGTVVPCCLDHEGDIPLGNLFTDDLSAILESPRAQAIYNGFSQKTATESLCRRCGYARRFL